MKKRMMCLALVFVLTFSAAMRPRQEAYAFAATATVATVALALIAACGVTFVSGNSRSISATVDDFLEKHASVKTFIEDLISNFGAGGKILLTEIHLYPWVKEGFRDLISAVRSYFSGDAGEGLGGGSVNIEAPSVAGWNISTDVVSETFGPFPTTSSSSEYLFFPSSFAILLGYRHRLSSGLTTLSLSLGYFDGASYYSSFYECKAANALDPLLSSSNRKTQSNSACSVSDATLFGFGFASYNTQCFMAVPFASFPDARPTVSALGGTGFYLPDFYHSVSGYSISSCFLLDGQSYGDMSLLQYVDWEDVFASLPSVPCGISGTATSDFVYAYPAGVTPDLLAQKWTDALETEGADIVINPVDAGELVGVSGYDVAYGSDTTAGAIVGVDLPAIPAEVPDAPVIPGEDADLSGITSKLGAILSGVKALPGQIAGTVIGTGELDWSALQGVSFKAVFPFCIPFDLADVLTSLRASPKEPLWEVDFSGTAFAPAGTVVIDLRQFSRLFAIIRFFIYGGFVVSLIVLTRKLIRG